MVNQCQYGKQENYILSVVFMITKIIMVIVKDSLHDLYYSDM